MDLVSEGHFTVVFSAVCWLVVFRTMRHNTPLSGQSAVEFPLTAILIYQKYVDKELAWKIDSTAPFCDVPLMVIEPTEKIVETYACVFAYVHDMEKIVNTSLAIFARKWWKPLH